MFHGQLKSSITCLTCHDVNENFEAFSTLGLSIPKSKPIICVALPQNNTKQAIKVKVQVHEMMTVGEVVELLRKDSLIEGEVFCYTSDDNHFRKFVTEEQLIFPLIEDYFYLYVKQEADVKNKLFFALMIDDEKNNRITFPRVFGVKESDSLYDLVDKIEKLLKRYLRGSKTIKLAIHNIDEKGSFFCPLCQSSNKTFFNCPCLVEKTPEELALIMMSDLTDSRITARVESEELKLADLNSLVEKPKISVNINIYDLLKYFTQDEIFDLDVEWNCSKCKKVRKAVKKLEINKFPDYLIFSLKRFKYDFYLMSSKKGSAVSEKNKELIEYPLENLDLKNFSVKKDDLKYNLYGVTNHDGTMVKGHYTAYCKHGDEWFWFDDKRVRSDFTRIVSEHNYILFYSKIK